MRACLPRLPTRCKPCDTPCMGARTILTESLQPLVDLVYPPRCPLCGDALAQQGGLCATCWSELEAPGEPSCQSCQRPIVSGHDTCWDCTSAPPLHTGVYAATVYDDASRKLILTFKHGGKIALARLLGQMMAARLPIADPGSGPPLLIPVPLHRWRLWGRGYNQAALLARELERNGRGQLLVDGLVRRKQTPSLGGLGSEERRKVLAGAIAVRQTRAKRIAGRDVILVDDVLTSGATSNACVEVLLETGAASVRIACFARVLSGAREHNTSPQNTLPKNTTPEAITAPGAT
ncbi:MAG: ComF family protein [Pseudomonadota bacterium]